MASVVSTAGTTSTPHACAERTAHLEKVFNQLGSLMSMLQDLGKEASAACIDGKIKLQTAELQELEYVRQKAWINECAAVADKLARIQELEQLGKKSVCHVEEHAWQQASGEAVEQGIEEKHRKTPSSKTSKQCTACRSSTWSRGPRVRRRVNPRLRASGTWSMDASVSTSSSWRSDGSCRGRNRVAGCTMAGLHG